MKMKHLLIAVPLAALGATAACVDDVAPLQVVAGAFQVAADCTFSEGDTPITQGEINTGIARGYNLAFVVGNRLDVSEPQLVGGEDVGSGEGASTINLTEVEVSFGAGGLESFTIPLFATLPPGEEVPVLLRLLSAEQVQPLRDAVAQGGTDPLRVDITLVFKGKTGGGGDVESAEVVFPLLATNRDPGCTRPPTPAGSCDPIGQNGLGCQ